MTGILVYDWRGQLRDLAYLRARYGDFVIREPAPGTGPAYRVRALRERADGDFDPAALARLRGTPAEAEWWASVLSGRAAATFIARVVDADGQPLPGVRVAFYWSDAPIEPDAGPAGGVLPGMVPGRADVGTTSDNGDVGWGMGKGAYYWPGKGEIGPHAVWVAGANTRSAIVLGFGMVAMTAHYGFDVEFERRAGEPGEGGDVDYFDESGAPRDAEWAKAMFGRQEVSRAEGLPAFRLTELRAASGEERLLAVRVLDVDGGPVTGVTVVLSRRDAANPEPRHAETLTDGRAVFSMGGTAEHSAIDGQGQYSIAVGGASDRYDAAGLVMLRKAPPRWLEPTFQLTDGGGPVVPPPEEPPEEPPAIDPDLRAWLLSRAEAIARQVAEIRALLEQAG